jgi:hypothetical protein
VISDTAIPTLVGEFVSGKSSQIAWAVWPLEVYPSGCLVRLRLAPTGARREYEDFRTLAATVQPLSGLEHERMVFEADTGELHQASGRLPNRGEGSTGEPWEHAWTVEYWWPRHRWSGDRLTLTWPAHDLRLTLPVDLPGMAAAADRPTASDQ